MLAPNGSNWLGIMPHEVINLNLSWEPKLNYPQKKIKVQFSIISISC